MGKVVTSQGLNEFVQSGKFETVTDDKPVKVDQAPPLEVKNPVESKVEEPKDEHVDEDLRLKRKSTNPSGSAKR